MSLTPQEAKTLKDIEAAAARGEDVFGDDEEIVGKSHTGADTGDELDDGDDSTTTTTTDDDAVTTQAQADADEAAAAAAAEADADDAAPQLAEPFTATVPEDYKAKRTELMTKKADAMKQLMDGTIDTDEYSAIESQVSADLEELTAQRIRAETLIEANTQTQQTYQKREIHKLIQRTKAEVDYAGDPKAAKQFDMAMSMLQADPDNAGLEFSELIEATHKVVASMRGVTLPTTKTTTTPPGERKPSASAPVTLRSLPTASQPNTNGNLTEQMARLKGEDYEKAFARLSPAEKRSMLDETEEA